MKNLEEKLKKLPRQKLSFKANFRMKVKIYRLMVKERFTKTFHLPDAHILFLNKSVLLSLVIIIVFTSTSMYAYASNSVTVGHVLYPIKKGIEETEKSVSFTDAAKAKVYSKMSERRLDEAIELSEKKEESANLFRTLNEAVRDMEKHRILIESEDKILNEDFYDEKIKKVEIMASNVEIEADEKVINSVATVLDEIKKYKTKNKEENDYSTKEDYREKKEKQEGVKGIKLENDGKYGEKKDEKEPEDKDEKDTSRNKKQEIKIKEGKKDEGEEKDVSKEYSGGDKINKEYNTEEEEQNREE